MNLSDQEINTVREFVNTVHATKNGEAWHVYPVNDLKAHEMEGQPCLCNPRIEIQRNGNYLVVHNAWDNRERRTVN